ENQGGVRRPSVRDGQCRAPPQDRPGGRTARREHKIRAAIERNRGGAGQRRPDLRGGHARGDGQALGRSEGGRAEGLTAPWEARTVERELRRMKTLRTGEASQSRAFLRSDT